MLGDHLNCTFDWIVCSKIMKWTDCVAFFLCSNKPHCVLKPERVQQPPKKGQHSELTYIAALWHTVNGS
jgi:hypothetical protein